MGDDDQKRNEKKKRRQPRQNDVDQFQEWPDFLADDDQGIMGDFLGEFDEPNYEEILTSPIILDSSSKFLSSVTRESESSSSKRRRDSDGVPVSAPKSFDPKQKGVAILPEWEPEPKICACCLNDQQLLRLTPCGHYICHRCLGEKIVKEHAGEVSCPNRSCSGAWKPEHFRRYVPREVIDRWLDAANEAKALENLREFACPICGERLTNDQMDFLIRTCTFCRSIFCMNWHMDLLCWKFKEIGCGNEYDDAVAAELMSSIAF